MCEANAYFASDGEEQLIMEAVDLLEPTETTDTWRLVSIFGDQKTVKGRIVQMNLVSHRIIFAAVPGRDD